MNTKNNEQEAKKLQKIGNLILKAKKKYKEADKLMFLAINETKKGIAKASFL